MNELNRLSSVLDAISDKFFTFEEFPNISRSRLPAGVCEAAMSADGRELAAFGAALSGKELEAMILDFPSLKTAEEWDRIGSILMTRFSPRIVKLIFSLFQAACNTESVRFLMKKTVEEARRRQDYPEPGAFFWAFGESEDFMEAVKTAFYKDSNELDLLFQTYHIAENTRLAAEIRRQCLEDAELPLIRKNVRHLVYLIENMPEALLFQTVTNYLQQFDVLNALDEVSQAVLKRLGEPSRPGCWSGFSEETKKRFTQWCFCHRLKLHSELFPEKYKILKKYYDQVLQCYELKETEALVIEFEKFFIVDIADRPCSYFYLKEDFERETGQWAEFGILPAFLKGDDGQVSARDYIIEEKDGPCILLRYEGIGLLYIAELLDMKTRPDADFRSIKSR